MSVAIVILAAGKGTRMNSNYQKILHRDGGKPMVQHLHDAAVAVASERPVFVVGPDETGVQAMIGAAGDYVVQAERLGTGHATMQTAALLKGNAEQVVVTYADMPLLRGETIQTLVEKQRESGAAVVLMSVMGAPSSSFGRIVRAESGNVIEICEVAEAKQRGNAADLLAIRELNAGVYCFDAQFLWDNIDQLPMRKARSGYEYYLTDMIEFAVQQGKLVDAIVTDDPDDCLGAGTRAELVAVERAFRRRAVRKAHDAGATIIDPAQTYIEPTVTVGRDTTIWPGACLEGNTTIGEACVIGPSTVIRSAQIGDRCTIQQAVIEHVSVPDDTQIAPFTHLAPEENRV